MLMRLMHRVPLATPRRLLLSRAVQKRKRHLSAEDRAGLAALQVEVEQGDSLYPRMTDQVTRHWNDDLLNDWGIHHFHLGTELRRKGFYGRTKNVALAMVEPHEVLLIDVLPHGSDYPDTWTEDGLLRIVRQNWPAVMTRYRVPGASNLWPPLSAENRRKLRAAGISLMVELDGVVYTPPGGGVTTDRGSVSTLTKRNAHMYELREVQRRWTLRYPEQEAQLRLLPRDRVLIETAAGVLWIPVDQGRDFERITTEREPIFRYMLERRTPF